MPRRESDSTTICCPVTPRERIVLEDLKASLGLTSDANLMRTALYHFAEWQLGKAAMDVRLFGLREAGGRNGTLPARRVGVKP